MKRWISVFLIFVLAIIFCMPQSAAVDGFGAAKEAEIISAWLEKYTSSYGMITEDTAVVVPYYTDGTLYVFGIHGEYKRADLCTWYIGDYLLQGCSEDEPYVYLNGEAYRLSDAYKAGLVGDEVLVGMRLGYMQMTRLQMYNRYDVNEDGVVTIADVVALRQEIVAPTRHDRWDIDGDRQTTVSDVIALRERLLAG